MQIWLDNLIAHGMLSENKTGHNEEDYHTPFTQ